MNHYQQDAKILIPTAKYLRKCGWLPAKITQKEESYADESGKIAAIQNRVG